MTAEHQTKLGIFLSMRSVPLLLKLPCLQDASFFLVPLEAPAPPLFLSHSCTPSSFAPSLALLQYWKLKKKKKGGKEGRGRAQRMF